MHVLTPQLTTGLYLFTTHITKNKIIAIVAVGVVVVVTVGVWLVLRRRVRV